jgi:hypothetical protein
MVPGLGLMARLLLGPHRRRVEDAILDDTGIAAKG